MARPIAVTLARLRRTPLPRPDEEGNKESRGRVLVVGGSATVPGAVLLAGVAALRAGAGKLQLATVASAASALAIAVPESLVVSLPESRRGEIVASRSRALLRTYVQGCDALLIGPGIAGENVAAELLRPLARHFNGGASLVLDAAAIAAIRDLPSLAKQLDGQIIVTPHAGEMANLLRADISDIEEEPAGAALEAASRYGVVVALKGPESWIATPDGTLCRYSEGQVGLATSGSGDTLAGIVAGLVARGASPLTAAMWGVYLHGAAGRALARRLGKIGFLARELLDQVPIIMKRVTA